MWRSLWRSIDRFSLQHFKYVVSELRQLRVVDRNNRELVVDLLQSIVEIVTYGDRQDPLIFECFMEYQVLSEFVRILKIGSNSRIEAPLLQYLSIMLQNMDSEHAIYYCFSNEYVNSIIAHDYKFDGGDLAQYYISFLRAVSSKINRDTLCLLVRVQGDAVVSFPLYSEALKFAQHGEKMIQTAVRALTLNIYNVSDDMAFKYITTPPVSNYFIDLVHNLKKQCIHLDSLVHSTKEMSNNQRRKELLLETDKIVDDLYYFKDILSVGDSRLSEVITRNLLDLLVYPVLLPSLQLRQSDGLNLSTITSLYIVSRLLQVVGGKTITNSVAQVILYPHISLEDANEDDIDHSCSSHFNDVVKLLHIGSESGAGSINGHPPSGHLPEYISSNSYIVDYPADDNVCPERSGILACMFSDNVSLLLASLFFLLTVAESKDLEHVLASMVGLSALQQGMNYGTSASKDGNRSIFVKFMPQILDALLKVLASEAPISVPIRWHTGWFMQKLLVFQGMKLGDHSFHLFNTSYVRCRECFQKELEGYWFDCIPQILRNEWTSCKAGLEKPIHSKDPLFLLELAVCQQMSVGTSFPPILTGDLDSSHVAWQRMVDAVKVYILHIQLKAFICNGDLLEKPLLAFEDGSAITPGRTHTSDLSSASFGSEVSLGSAIPCRIAFSNAGIRDIHLIPVARGTSGKLLLVEKHPFRSQRGVVIAIAPLAGLSPRIDEDHPTWLHLRIREFDPKLSTSNTRGYSAKTPNLSVDGRWTLGFRNAKACEAAQSVILEEISKQRSSVRSALAPLLQNSCILESPKGKEA